MARSGHRLVDGHPESAALCPPTYVPSIPLLPRGQIFRVVQSTSDPTRSRT